MSGGLGGSRDGGAYDGAKRLSGKDPIHSLNLYSDEQMKTGAGSASSMLPVPEDAGGICT